ncbi:glycosyltransferase [Comamonas aquatica]|uniref:O-linked N-acetylglucosamine transferase, SPINDLY family protein n=1 Tax=Comamonas aquatica TaxID=225991 RepID=UPI00244829F2|nr:glycosyltransferase [Comamonas aquatica]MDH1674378.1 glycosyltransferase [Comamonas aquatica]MDH1677930.1 glycosyltransferase [Comamonas aquatica]
MSESISSVAPASLAQELHRINTTLIPNNQFLEALTQLMLLAKDHVTDAQLWLLIGLVYTRIANWSNAVAALETAIALNPRLHAANRLRALALFSMGRKEQACKLIDQVVKKSSEGGDWMLRAYIHAHTSRDPMNALQVARDWGRRFADPLTRNAQPLRVLDRNPRKKLKIGYVTADFREHSIAFFMLPVLSYHNPDVVEVHVYSNGPTDHITTQMRPLVSHWHDIQALDDEVLHRQIRAEGIDVLVDLSGFTQGHRLGVFARRAAPVQVTWMGYMHTLGMKAMDYRLVDFGIAPLGHEKFYSETLFRLNVMASYAPPTYAPLCEEPPMLKNGYPTLISLNSSAKITDDMLRIWGRILHARSDARLIIMVKEDSAEAAQAYMQPRVEAAGMPLERVSVLHQQPLNQFMEMGHIADIALDTSPISGGTTTLHALWMGMLLVTMDAERGVDACTARTLRGIGFGGEIAKDEQGYIDAALLLMNSPERLRQRRLDLRDRMRKSVLMDYATRTVDLEKAFRLMWLNYLQGKPKTLNVKVNLEYELAQMDAVA